MSSDTEPRIRLLTVRDHALAGEYVPLQEWQVIYRRLNEQTECTTKALKDNSCLQNENAALRAALQEIAKFSAAHHDQQPDHFWLHALTVDIPEWVRNVLDASADPHQLLDAPVLYVVDQNGVLRFASYKEENARMHLGEADRGYTFSRYIAVKREAWTTEQMREWSEKHGLSTPQQPQETRPPKPQTAPDYATATGDWYWSSVRERWEWVEAAQPKEEPEA